MEIISLNYKSHLWLKAVWTYVYNHRSEYLLKSRYKNDLICPCVFIKKSGFDFFILVINVDNINLIGTLEEL
jgi:hypothetical protein